MPHKKQKRSIRDAATAAAGYDNPPTAGDSIPHPNHVAAAASKPVGVLAPENKKRKAKKEQPKDKKDTFGGRKDLGGLSKSMHRVLNAGALREEYQQNKKRKLEEIESKKNPNQKKATLTPLPYESLSTFNRRVEMTLRPSIDTAIRASKASAQKKKVKKGETKAGDTAKAGEDDEAPVQDTTTTLPSGKVKPKATPETSVDPFARRPKTARATEFVEASQVKRVSDVVQAPPVLSKSKRGQKVTSVTEPLPASRMPVSGALKAMMEQEREKAVAAYRVMKEQREREQRVAATE